MNNIGDGKSPIFEELTLIDTVDSTVLYMHVVFDFRIQE